MFRLLLHILRLVASNVRNAPDDPADTCIVIGHAGVLNQKSSRQVIAQHVSGVKQNLNCHLFRSRHMVSVLECELETNDTRVRCQFAGVWNPGSQTAVGWLSCRVKTIGAMRPVRNLDESAIDDKSN